MASKPVWMPFYVIDYLSDTLDLKTEEHGAYCLLLMIAWRQPDGAIPNDMKWLQRALSTGSTDMHGNRFNRLIKPLLARFFKLGFDNKFRNNRLSKEWEKSRNLSGKQKQNAEKRWSATKKTNDLADATAMPARASLQSQYNNNTEERKKDGAGQEAAPLLLSVVSPLPVDSDEAAYFRRARELLGAKGGGIAKQLLIAKGADYRLARSTLELASTKGDPTTYLRGAIHASTKEATKAKGEEIAGWVR